MGNGGVKGQARVGFTLRNSIGAIEKFDSQARIEAMAGLILNGLGGLKNNENFSLVTFRNSDAPGGAFGHFYTNNPNMTFIADGLIPVNANASYRMNVFARAFTSIGAGRQFFAGCVEFDLDGSQIGTSNYMMLGGVAGNTQTTLTRVLQPGATKMYVANAASWANPGAGAYERVARFGRYKTASGKTYGDYDYSRWMLTSAGVVTGVGSAAWNAGAIVSIGGGEWEITLPAALPAFPADMVALYPGGLPIGHPVCNATTGGTYKYFAASAINIDATWLASWKPYSGTIGGIDLTGLGDSTKFSPGTAGIRLMTLPNLGGSGNAEIGFVVEFLRINLT
jgi:hypothetical protein